MDAELRRSEYRRRQGIAGENKDVKIAKARSTPPTPNRAQKVCGEATAEAPRPVPSDAIPSATEQ